MSNEQHISYELIALGYEYDCLWKTTINNLSTIYT